MLGYVPHHEDCDLENGLQCTRLNTWMLTRENQVVDVRVVRAQSSLVCLTELIPLCFQHGAHIARLLDCLYVHLHRPSS